MVGRSRYLSGNNPATSTHLRRGGITAGEVEARRLEHRRKAEQSRQLTRADDELLCPPVFRHMSG